MRHKQLVAISHSQEAIRASLKDLQPLQIAELSQIPKSWRS